RPRRQRRHTIHHHHIHRPRPHQQLHDLQRLLPRIRLRHQQLVRVHPQRPRVRRIQRMLRIHERRHPTRTLRLRHDMQRQRRLPPRLRPVHRHHPPPPHPPPPPPPPPPAPDSALSPHD